MKRLFWSMTAVAAVLAAGSLSVVAQASDAPGIAWGKCPAPPVGVTVDPTQQCGTVTVPLDYRHPDGKTISIAVSKVPATNPAKRRGVLLMNPGGPGGEGLNLPSTFPASPSVAAVYDRIGFDPRGVGHSNPVSCGFTAAEMTPPYPYPAPDGSIAANVAFAKSAAARCAARSGGVLPFLTTANTARDLDRIRAALGEKTISYVGTSYGTYLGAVYATLFSARLDRALLDSSIDPAKVYYGNFRLESTGFAARFPDAASYAAARDASLHLGATPEAVTASWVALTKKLDRKPVTVAGAPVALSGNVLRGLTTMLLTSDQALPLLVGAWQAAASLAAGSATDADVQALQQLFALADPASAVSPGVPADNTLSAAYAVACDDVRWPSDVRVYARNVAADRAAHPLSAGALSNIWPCAFWPTAPVEPPVRVTASGPRNILMLHHERDPLAALEAGRGMHRALGRRSVLVTVDGGGHGVYGVPGSCATAAADAFLLSGTLPARDTRCA
ncbi:alpha/beta hydrolase [Cryptosporangium phraense]|uniref:Alpha/beta hydrolase n=1 Tax=Cryptosporangium phraense TaxID=2593070 RepID=A0A545AH73_9ACTN|nr:alpha/beta hydrolase [Cryptosporangium phraense]TQS40672.1 alpha/beta hydrolase [Cryptosporangium phraense]